MISPHDKCRVGRTFQPAKPIECCPHALGRWHGVQISASHELSLHRGLTVFLGSADATATSLPLQNQPPALVAGSTKGGCWCAKAADRGELLAACGAPEAGGAISNVVGSLLGVPLSGPRPEQHRIGASCRKCTVKIVPKLTLADRIAQLAFAKGQSLLAWLDHPQSRSLRRHL
jgi:hypothetical protein